MPFYQVSSLDSEGIDELFSSLLRDIEEPFKYLEKKIQPIEGNNAKLIEFSHNETNDEYGMEALNRIVPDMVDSVIGSSYAIFSGKKKSFSNSIEYPSPHKSGTVDPAFLERVRSQFSNKKSSIRESGTKISFVKHDIRDIIDDDPVIFE